MSKYLCNNGPQLQESVDINVFIEKLNTSAMDAEKKCCSNHFAKPFSAVSCKILGGSIPLEKDPANMLLQISCQFPCSRQWNCLRRVSPSNCSILSSFGDSTRSSVLHNAHAYNGYERSVAEDFIMDASATAVN